MNAVGDVSDPYKYMEERPNLFEGVGKLKGHQVKLHVDASVAPIAQPHHRTPFHSRKKLKAELERLEREDIIERTNGPTPWVSPIVIVPKPNNSGRNSPMRGYEMSK